MKKAKIEINLNNLIYNFEKVREITGQGENVIPVVKANAYNVGVYNVVKTLLSIKEPQKKFFVFALKEGIELRKMFPELERIFVLNSLFKGDEEIFKKYSLTPVINDFRQLELSKNANIKDIVLQFNTGLNRNGFEVSDTEKVRKYIDENDFNVLMIMSHFACADNVQHEANERQINNFKKVAKYFPEKEILKGIEASDSIINFDLSDFCNTCRPGKILYGYFDGFKDVISIKSYIRTDGTNLYLPFGINNGVFSQYGNGDCYVLYNGVKIFIKLVQNDKIILDTQDKTLIDKEVVVLGESLNLKTFLDNLEMASMESIGRFLENCYLDPENFVCNLPRNREMISESKYKAIYEKNAENKYKAFYSQITEKRIVDEDGIVGYDGLVSVKKGDKLATFFGGYLDGLSSIVSKKKCYVFIQKNDGEYTKCQIYGKISMDQIVVKITDDDYNNIDIENKVIIFNKDYPVELFEENTNYSKEEIFYCLGKSLRIETKNVK